MLTFGIIAWLLVGCCFIATIYFIVIAEVGGRTKLIVLGLWIFAWAWDIFEYFFFKDPLPIMIGFLIQIGLCMYYVFHFKYSE